MILSVLSWNIDGLTDDDDNSARFNEIIRLIEETSADIVCLQEVVPQIRLLLCQRLFGKYLRCGSPTNVHYYTMILLNKASMELTRDARRDRFSCGSDMGRDKLSVICRKSGDSSSRPIIVTTSHLESGVGEVSAVSALSRSAQLRFRQYTELLMELAQLLPGERVDSIKIACGDFNLRQTEDVAARAALAESTTPTSSGTSAGINALMAKGQGMPSAGSRLPVADSYEVARGGALQTLSYTWQRLYPGSAPSQPARARFDRMLFSQCNDEIHLPQGGYRLVGTNSMSMSTAGPGVALSERATRERGYSTPSDHFGMLCQFVMRDNKKKRSMELYPTNVANATVFPAHFQSGGKLAALGNVTRQTTPSLAVQPRSHKIAKIEGDPDMDRSFGDSHVAALASVSVSLSHSAGIHINSAIVLNECDPDSVQQSDEIVPSHTFLTGSIGSSTSSRSNAVIDLT